MGNPQLVSVDSDTRLLPASVLAALDAYNNGKYWKQAPFGRVLYSGAGALGSFTLPTSDWSSSGSIIAIGRNAMGKLPDSRDSIAIGDGAMGNSTLTRENVAIGGQALYNVVADDMYYNQSQQNGTRNVGIGGNAGYFINKGHSHTAIGRNSASGITGGRGIVAVGYGACGGYAPIGLSGQIENWAAWGDPGQTVYTTAVGYNALAGNSASSTVAVGGYALNANKKSERNTAVGASAMQALDTQTGFSGGTVTQLNINGTYVQSGATLTITATAHSLAVGDIVYFRLLDGASQTFQSDTVPAYVANVPSSSTFTINSPKSIDGSGNALVSSKETSAQASRNEANTATGYQAGYALATGSNNTFDGAGAAAAVTTASQSTAIGSNAFGSATSLTNSAALGFFAAGSMTSSASQVTALGASALRNKVDGTAMTDAFTNVTGVGYDSRVSGSNQLQLGNTSQTVYAQAAVQTRSDERDKAEIRDTVLDLEFIEALRPVDFKWDRREDYTEYDEDGNGVGLRERDGSKRGKRFHHGFIAQEVGAAINKLGVDFGGYQDHTINGGDDVQSVGYEEVIAPLVRASQQLAGMVREQADLIEGLQKRVAELEKR